MPVSPFIVFVLAVVWGSHIIISYNGRLRKAAKVLESAFEAKGTAWNYWSDYGFRIKLMTDPESIFTKTDSASITQAKKNLIAVRQTMGESLIKGFLVIVAGFFGFIAAAILEYAIRAHWGG